MRPALSFALLLPLTLAACGGGGAGSPQAARTTQLDLDQVKASAPVVSELVRAAAATACNLPVSITTQDRAARIEAAALEIARREGGVAARDNYLRSVQPPSFEPRQRGRDRAAYCNPKRIEIERMDGFLAGPDGAALAQRADTILAGR